MIKKLKEVFLQGEKLAQFYEKKGDAEKAFNEYLKLENYLKAGEMMQQMGKWHEAAGLFILANDVTRARQALEICFKKNKNWEVFPLLNGKSINIEDWLKRKGQTRRFVRYVKDVTLLNGAGVPILVQLAERLKNVFEFKSAAELYERAFYILNGEGRVKGMVKNEVLLKYAAENFARAHLPKEAAGCLKELIIVEVEIGEKFLRESKTNPYKDYSPHLRWAGQMGFLDQLIELFGDYDPFRIAYDLLKIGAFQLSIDLFFKYYGKVSDKVFSESESKRRNEKIAYCLNQYVIYYSEKMDYQRAADIAIMNSQKEMAKELLRKAKEQKGKHRNPKAVDIGTTDPALTREKSNKPVCRDCGEELDPQWGICPGCGKLLHGVLCACGKRIKSHWVKCPHCLRALEK